MQTRKITLCAAATFALIAAPATGQTKEHAPVSLRSTNRLAQDRPRSESWTYVSPDFRASRFSRVCIPPARIYAGPDAQFPGTTPADKQRFADILAQRVREALSSSFPVLPYKAPGCLTMQLTLVGLENTQGGVATATRVTPMGFALSTVNSLRGKKGSFTGSALVALEVTGGRKDELLVAAVRRRSPDALDIPATLSMTDTMNAISRDFGRELRDRLLASGVMSGR